MKFEKFNISDKKGNSNCVVRSLCKILNKKYDEVYNDLIKITKDLNCTSFNDITVFEKYMEDNKIFKVDYDNDIVKNLKLDNQSYIVFCCDKKEFYHMIPIINNIVYDKNTEYEDLYVISIYRLM